MGNQRGGQGDFLSTVLLSGGIYLGMQLLTKAIDDPKLRVLLSGGSALASLAGYLQSTDETTRRRLYPLFLGLTMSAVSNTADYMRWRKKRQAVIDELNGSGNGDVTTADQLPALTSEPPRFPST